MATSSMLSLALLLAQAPTVHEYELPDGRFVQAEVLVGADDVKTRHGSFKVFPEKGADWVVSGSFEDGLRDGTWRFQYSSGDKAANGKYRKGKRIGTWSVYFQSGDLAARGKFKNDLPSGKWDFMPLGGGKRAESRSITSLVGESDEGGYRYSGYLVDGEPSGLWHVVRPGGSLRFRGMLNAGDIGLAREFRHFGGIEDSRFFKDTLVPPNAEDYVYLGPNEYGDLLPAVAVSSGEAPTLEEAVRGLLSVTPIAEGAKTAPPDVKVIDARIRKTGRKSTRSVLADPRGPAERRAELASALAVLCATDWTDETKLVYAAALVEGIVEPALGMPVLGWSFDPESADENRLAVLRAHSLMVQHPESSLFWSIDGRVPTWPSKRHLEFAPEFLVSELDPLQWLSGTDRSKVAKAAKKNRGKKPKADRGAPSSAAMSMCDDGTNWLLQEQLSDGRWMAAASSVSGEVREGEGLDALARDTGVTALAMLAIMSANPKLEDPERRAAVSAGARFLLGCMQATGHFDAPPPSYTAKGEWVVGYESHSLFYVHSLCVQSLSELYMIEPTPRLLGAIRSGLAVLDRAKISGGTWRYGAVTPGQSDTSVTFWVTRALVSAERAGIAAEFDYKEDVLAWIEMMIDPKTSRIGYQEAGSISARVPGENLDMDAAIFEVLTAEGVAATFMLDPDAHDKLRGCIDLLYQTSPRQGGKVGPDVDYCYFLAGSEALSFVEGSKAARWRDDLAGVLSDLQRKDGNAKGSWDPSGPWGYSGGRVYSTAMAMLSLL